MNWPSGMAPGAAPVHARNEITIEADPDRIWRWLCKASFWPRWYPNCTWAKTPGRELERGTRFTFKTFGVVVNAQITVFEPNTRLEWEGRAIGTHAYHGWLITSKGREKTQVLTEETEEGWLPFIGRKMLAGNLERGHQLWLDRLKEKAEKGEPG